MRVRPVIANTDFRHERNIEINNTFHRLFN